MNMEEFAKAAEASLNKLDAEIAEHNAQVNKALAELDHAESLLDDADAVSDFELAQHASLRAYTTLMRIQLKKEYMPGRLK